MFDKLWNSGMTVENATIEKGSLISTRMMESWNSKGQMEYLIASDKVRVITVVCSRPGVIIRMVWPMDIFASD